MVQQSLDHRPEINLEPESPATGSGDSLPAKTRVNLQIRAHITTYYHLQIVIANDQWRLLWEWHWPWTPSPSAAPSRVSLQRPETKEKQKRVHHFLVIIFSDPRSRLFCSCPLDVVIREEQKMVVDDDDEDAGGDLARFPMGPDQ